jgi:hypothetical protein
VFVKAEGPSGRAKIRSGDPKHALGLVQYLRTIGYNAWIEDTNGNEMDEKARRLDLIIRIRPPADATRGPASGGGLQRGALGR